MAPLSVFYPASRRGERRERERGGRASASVRMRSVNGKGEKQGANVIPVGASRWLKEGQRRHGRKSGGGGPWIEGLGAVGHGPSGLQQQGVDGVERDAEHADGGRQKSGSWACRGRAPVVLRAPHHPNEAPLHVRAALQPHRVGADHVTGFLHQNLLRPPCIGTGQRHLDPCKC